MDVFSLFYSYFMGDGQPGDPQVKIVDWATQDRDTLIQRLLDQNDRLIAALVASSPLEIVKALNPPPAPLPAARDPWEADTPHRTVEDPWGDPRVPTEVLLSRPHPGHEDGWVDPPFVAQEVAADGPSNPAE